MNEDDYKEEEDNVCVGAIYREIPYHITTPSSVVYYHNNCTVNRISSVKFAYNILDKENI